jgi:phosphoenolpyruvate mutase
VARVKSDDPTGATTQFAAESRIPLTPPDERRWQLRRLLAEGRLLRLLEAHSGLTGLIVERATAHRDGRTLRFDGIWFSSFTNATIKGQPDNEGLDLASRLHALTELLDVTTKPILYDADSGGSPEHLAATVRALERLGVSGLIVHDRVGSKCNSLSVVARAQEQDDVESFCAKLRVACAARGTDDFLVIARVESLIVGAGLSDAVMRARAYVEAGADGVMMHSRAATADEVLESCRGFHRSDPDTPLVAVPSTYPGVSEEELAEVGVRIVIYANQLLRSAYPAMASAAHSILERGRALEAEAFCIPIQDVLRLVGGNGVEPERQS